MEDLHAYSPHLYCHYAITSPEELSRQSQILLRTPRLHTFSRLDLKALLWRGLHFYSRSSIGKLYSSESTTVTCPSLWSKSVHAHLAPSHLNLI